MKDFWELVFGRKLEVGEGVLYDRVLGLGMGGEYVRMGGWWVDDNNYDNYVKYINNNYRKLWLLFVGVRCF